MPIQTEDTIPKQPFVQAHNDIEQCRAALTQWQRGATRRRDADNYDLYFAVEALMRAVATLAQVVEDQQAPYAPSCNCQGIRHTCERFGGALITVRED